MQMQHNCKSTLDRNSSLVFVGNIGGGSQGHPLTLYSTYTQVKKDVDNSIEDDPVVHICNFRIITVDYDNQDLILKWKSIDERAIEETATQGRFMQKEIRMINHLK